MENNLHCHFCGIGIYRNNFEKKQSKSGLFFCSKRCKNIHQEIYREQQFYTVPEENPLFEAVKNIYKEKVKNEWITNITIRKMEPDNVKTFKEYVVSASARTTDPTLAGKTPDNISYIKDCFNKVKLDDINKLKEIDIDLSENKKWKTISVKYWNENSITYQLKSYYDDDDDDDDK